MFFKYIYENDLGFTTYDKYFNYIRSLEGSIPNINRCINTRLLGRGVV